MSSAADLLNAPQLTRPLLVGIYNSAAENPVAKFQDRETASRQVWKVLVGRLAPEVPAAKAEKMGQGAAPKKRAYNPTPKASNPKNRPPRAAGTTKGTRRVKLLALKPGLANPYRAGSKSFKAFEICVANPDKTYGELVKMGARSNTINGMLRDGLATTK